MSVALISPNLVVQRSDPFTTGIVYMPIGLAYVAASMREAGLTPRVIDAFGEQPSKARREGKFLMLGLPGDEVARRLPPDTKVTYVYANSLVSHLSTIELVKTVKAARPAVPALDDESFALVADDQIRGRAQQPRTSVSS